MGIAYTVDTALKVARFGIDSVAAITEDHLLEELRRYYCQKENLPYEAISSTDKDSRARRVTAYLNVVQLLLNRQMKALRLLPFNEGTDLDKCFQLLPPESPLRRRYQQQRGMPDGPEKSALQEQLRDSIQPGAIHVNIMTKCDKVNYDKAGAPLPVEYNDAMSALRGFANSCLQSSIVFSAGMNPRLYGYCEQFEDFFPDAGGNIRKKIILKVSDYRSALIQGKFLAKKGLWVSEFRVESGLNCGGHAFATDGFLLGPVLEEFRENKAALSATLWELYSEALRQKQKTIPLQMLPIRLSVQGGIGTNAEHRFLLRHYGFDSAGWGTPFLLVPEATNVDEQTLKDLIAARKEDFYLSDASPLGVPFHNFRKSRAGLERLERIEKGRPGSPCYNKFLSNNTEFTEQPICTASRQYQSLKIKQINGLDVSPDERQAMIEKVTEKECICQGLGTAVYLKNEIPAPHKLEAVSICPGPNMAYFSGQFTLQQMTRHIYEGSTGMIAASRPHLFINEAVLYLDYLEKQTKEGPDTPRHQKYLEQFGNNLLDGFTYYSRLVSSLEEEAGSSRELFREDLQRLKQRLTAMMRPVASEACC